MSIINCEACKLVINNTEEVIFCDSCRAPYHYNSKSADKNCSNLTTTEARTMTLQKRILFFFCENCTTAYKNVPNLLRKIDDLNDQIVALKAEVQELKNEKKSSRPDLEIFQEIEDRQQRSKNIILYNVAESQSNKIEERINHDTTETISILSSISINVTTFKTFRLGRSSGTTRPLKVILNDQQLVQQCLVNRKKLNGQTRLGADLTIMQRDLIKNTYNELENRKAKGEQDISVRFIRGVPKILKSQKVNEVPAKK